MSFAPKKDWSLSPSNNTRRRPICPSWQQQLPLEQAAQSARTNALCSSRSAWIGCWVASLPRSLHQIAGVVRRKSWIPSTPNPKDFEVISRGTRGNAVSIVKNAKNAQDCRILHYIYDLKKFLPGFHVRTSLQAPLGAWTQTPISAWLARVPVVPVLRNWPQTALKSSAHFQHSNGVCAQIYSVPVGKSRAINVL